MLVCLCSLFAGLVQAQDSARLKHSGTYQQGYDFYSRRALTQPLQPVEQYAIVSASYAWEKGDFVPRQEAAAQREMQFLTEGTRKVKAYRVSGSFAFSRMFKDSMGYTLRSQVGPAPYYFYSQAKGNWEISNYKLQGIVSRSLLKDKISVSVGGDFRAGNAWRSNDPRTEEFNHDVTGETAVHYAINGDHTIGIGGGYRRLAEENSNEYRNKDNQHDATNNPYLNRIQYGYGLSEIRTTYQVIERRATGTKLNAIYRGQFDWGNIAATAEYSEMQSDFYQNPKESNTTRLTYGSFDEDIRHFDLLWELPRSTGNSWSIRSIYQDHYGKDFQTELNGNNYIFNEQLFTLQPLMAHQNTEGLHYEAGLKAGWSKLYRADGTTEHRASYKNADFGIFGGWYISGKQPENFLKLSAELNWRKNLDAAVTVPSQQETSFSKEVVYYDYYFHGANYTELTGGILYNRQVRNLPFFLKMTLQYRKAKLPDASLAAAELPGTDRWRSVLTLGFTL